MRHIGRAIAHAIDERAELLVIEAPPRHGKSMLCAQWAPAWYLATRPTAHVGIASYGAELAQSHGRIVRNLLAEHGHALDVRLAGDSAAVNRWHTTAGGSCTSIGVGGATTGFGFNLVVIDDPIKDAEEADSETMRAKIIEWFQSVVWTRREPNALVIVMATRWHEGDLIGWILGHHELGQVARHIRLPALAESNDELGRKPNEALWPSQWPRATLDRYQAILSARWWSALYQQRPTAAEGAEILRHWWQWYDALPVPRDGLEYVAASWDCTFRDKKTSDWVVGQVWGVYGAYRYLLDQVRGRMGFVETAKAILATHEQWKPNVSLVELAANGDAIVETLQGIVPAIVGESVQGKGGKVARARAVTPQIRAGQVFLPRRKFSDELIEECAGFPLGKHDDQVDAMSQALGHLGAWRSEPATLLTAGDNRFVPPHIAELQARGVLGGLGLAPRHWKL